MLIIYKNSQDFKIKDNSQGNKYMDFAPKRPMGLKISENDFGTSPKVPNFIYLSLPVEKLRGIKMRVLQNFEDFSLKYLFKFIHLMTHKIFKFLKYPYFDPS